MSQPAHNPALLVLEDGRSFAGTSYGATGETFGEAVFTTGMTGYQETLTDPSYHRQIVTQTAPHIGNTGVNDEDDESQKIWVAGYVVRDPARVSSNWRATRSLDEQLKAQGIVGISGIDTRALTRHLRERGAMRAGISTEILDAGALRARVLEAPEMTGLNLVDPVTTPKPYRAADVIGTEPTPRKGRVFRVAAYDYGIKLNILRLLSEAGCDVTVLPASYPASDVLKEGYDGVFLSNGPGDPAAVRVAIENTKHILGERPLFGICLGHQILGLALGATTYKLKFGHRGINQPVKRLSTQTVEITSHNHGFAVDPTPLEDGESPFGAVAVSHRNLNDGTCEGLRCSDVPAFSVQYHPEAAPGPHDARYLFEEFIRSMEAFA
jgi:carbamoyl-phosphate synthase small subunit